MKKIGWLLGVCLLLAACATKSGEGDKDLPVTETPTATIAATPSEAEPLTAGENTDEDTADVTPVNEPADAVPEIDYDTVKPNEVGNIMIIMYHGLTDENPAAYDRTREAFWNDLQTMYDQGYRLMSMKDLINNHITVAAGYTPVLLTFDDGRDTAFSLVEQDGELTVAPGCAVDILNRFCAENPDFGNAATFYINYHGEPFQGAGTIQERLLYLLDYGYEIGNHTYAHDNLRDADSPEAIQEVIGKLDQWVRELTGVALTSLAYPFGARPVEAWRSYALAGTYEGQTYQYALGLREGQSTITASPNHIQYDPLNMPRVRGTDASTPDNEVQDLGYYLRYYERYPDRRYISDGNPYRVSVPAASESLVNVDNLGELELFIY